MRLLEYESKAILGKAGFSVPRGQLAEGLEQVIKAAEEIGYPLVLKPQVPLTGRSRLGAIGFANSESELSEHAGKLLGTTLGGHVVSRLLVEQKISVIQEIFAAVIYDPAEKRPAIIVNPSGGAGVEDRLRNQSTVKLAWSVQRPIPAYKARNIAFKAGLRGPRAIAFSKFIVKLYDVFRNYDAVLVETNPVGIVGEDKVVVLDAHINLDDEAFQRHPELTELGISFREERARPVTEFERKAMEIDRMDYRGVAGRVIEFEGDLGLIIGGGGASLTIFDAVRRHGGRPANYCEVGGNPTVKKVRELTKLILMKPGVKGLAVITNVLNNTRVDLLARGVIGGLLDLGIEPSGFPIIFRIAGAWEEDGYKILEKYGVSFHGRETSIDESAKRAVALTRRA